MSDKRSPCPFCGRRKTEVLNSCGYMTVLDQGDKREYSESWAAHRAYLDLARRNHKAPTSEPTQDFYAQFGNRGDEMPYIRRCFARQVRVGCIMWGLW